MPLNKVVADEEEVVRVVTSGKCKMVACDFGQHYVKLVHRAMSVPRILTSVCDLEQHWLVKYSFSNNLHAQHDFNNHVRHTKI